MVGNAGRMQPMIVTLCCAFLTGCASSPWNSASNGGRFAARHDANRQQGSQLGQADPQHQPDSPASTESLPLPGQIQQTENAFLASMKEAANTLAKPLTIEPTYIRPNDPTSLSGGPEMVGADLHYHAARVCESQQNTPAAITHYERALQTDHNHVRTLIAYARLLDREGEFQEAERLYRQAAQLEPQNAIALNDLGMLYARQRMFDAALQSLDRAVALQPSNERYRNNIAIVLIDSGRPSDALGHLAAVHGAPVAHYNLGYLLMRKGMQDQALGHLRQAVQLKPDFAPARQMLTKLTAAMNQQHQAPAATPPIDRSNASMELLPPIERRAAYGPPTRPLPLR